ncbi:MAG: DUF4160 domain-containing protein [Bacteroidota bacterium]|nr:DUF4160 domain-containing protein [Bacteroidota bacterium]
MPELFRFFGFVFYFYSKEHEPIHVHVAGNDGFAKFAYDEETKTFSLSESKKHQDAGHEEDTHRNRRQHGHHRERLDQILQ